MVKKDLLRFITFLLIIVTIPYFVKNDYFLGIFIFTALNCLSCIGLCLLMGYAGQISLGHSAFIAIGAYTSSILTVKLALSPFVAIFAGIIIVSIIAFIVGTPTLRLKGHYLAMATLGFGEIIHIVAVASVKLTGGPEGINSIPKISLFGLIFDNDIKFYYFSWTIVFLGLFFALNLIHSRIGRALQAIHDSEKAALSFGINTSFYKIQIFIISAVYASISGSLYAHYVSYIDPVPFGITHSILLVTMVAVGGMRYIWGAVIGSIILTILPEFLTFTTSFFQGIGIAYKTDYDTLIYGTILLFIMLFLPEGIYHGFQNLFQNFWELKIRMVKIRG